ncbi:hypothetical protein [Actinomadura latina]|uniref:Uncharacterized protein n=1 Tax=Actinomadura latina TaxID=163603 RepID=A0A846YRK3_9ACTN|nr:hypothetical protein [Actinomadura latina]NKZ03440.1 hypothetical protein [Actinomadura latina]
MTGDRRTAVVRISPARQSMTRKKAVGLTEEERQLLLAELAEITAELDELHARTRQITARVHGAESTCPARESGAA